MWRRTVVRTTNGHAGDPLPAPAHNEASDPWSDIHTRARVVHALACAGASSGELARLAAGDPAVIIAAITHDGHPRDYSVLTRDMVVGRLERLLRVVALQRVAVDADWEDQREATTARHDRAVAWRWRELAGAA